MPPEETKTTRERSGGAQLGREQAGEQQRAEHVGGDGQLVALGRAPALVDEHTGVVEHAAQVGAALAKREPTKARTASRSDRSHSQVSSAGGVRRRAGRATRRRRGLEPVAVAADHVHAGAAGREAGGTRPRRFRRSLR